MTAGCWEEPSLSPGVLKRTLSHTFPDVKLTLVATLSMSRESPMTSLLGKPLGKVIMTFILTDIDCDIDYPVILTQNHFGKRTIIPRCECT